LSPPPPVPGCLSTFTILPAWLPGALPFRKGWQAAHT
jgi:hypothetical protein